MTDHLDYDRLLERGEHLSGPVYKDLNRLSRGVDVVHDFHCSMDDLYLALALLERHLAEKAAEAAVMLAEQVAEGQEITIIPLDKCPDCGALQDRGAVSFGGFPRVALGNDG